MKRWFVLAVFAIAIASYFIFDLGSFLTLDTLKTKHDEWLAFYQANQVQVIAVYFIVYVILTALSLPMATLITLAGGAIFGFWTGLIVVSFASTIGSTLAFTASRYVFRSSVQSKFGRYLNTINEGIEKDGKLYLLSLRLVPAFPFFVINLVMGLTPMKTFTFYWVSQVGMLAGTAAYVYAGTQLATINSLESIVSAPLLIAFAVLGIFPIVAKVVLDKIKHKRLMSRFEKPEAFDTNMVVIGAGSGGLVSAYIAAAVKAKVTLIEKHKMGGDCLNTGCVPSKALIRSAKFNQHLKRATDFGFSEASGSFEFKNVMKRVHDVIAKIEPHDSVERYTNLGVDCVQGEAKILSPYQVEVNGETITTQNIVIATGARPFVPPIQGIENVDILTSDNLWQLEALPERLLILGGGPIGCELAQSFNRLGAKVTQVEMLPRLMIREDEEVSQLVAERFVQEGVDLRLAHRAKTFIKRDGKNLLVCDHNGEAVEIEFDRCLVAVGRKANSEGFGLEELDIATNPNGTIKVDAYLRATYPNVFAVGDVAGPYQFTHVASHQAWYAAVNALFGKLKKFRVDYRVIPWATFVEPEVARVGLNELEAKEKDIPYEVTKYGIDDLDRAIADSEAHGFVKVLTVPGKDKILGVTIVGEHAGDLIAEYVLAIKHGLGLNKILGTIHIYPTLAEANKFAAGEWKRAHVSDRVMRWLKKFHARGLA